MSGKIDHSRRNMRDRMFRHGADDLTDDSFPAGLIIRSRPRPSKEEQRKMLSETDWAAPVTRLITCACGHRATVKIPQAAIGHKSLKCSRCGRRTKA